MSNYPYFEGLRTGIFASGSFTCGTDGIDGGAVLVDCLVQNCCSFILVMSYHDVLQ